MDPTYTDPTKGRIVLFFDWRRPEEAAALVVGAALVAPGGSPAAADLQVFHPDGSISFEPAVPHAEAEEDELVVLAGRWRDWDLAADRARASGSPLPTPPEQAGRSWRWPPRNNSGLPRAAWPAAAPADAAPTVPPVEAALRKLDEQLGTAATAVDKIRDGDKLTTSEIDALASELGGQFDAPGGSAP